MLLSLDLGSAVTQARQNIFVANPRKALRVWLHVVAASSLASLEGACNTKMPFKAPESKDQVV